MKRRRVIILAGAVVVVLGVCLAMVWPRDEGPEYNGRTLKEWMLMAADNDKKPGTEAEVEAMDEAVKSIRAIGSKGAPYFLKWIQYEPPKYRRNLEALVDRLPSRPLRTVILRAVNRRQNLARNSMYALAAVEPEDIKSVVAELERLSRDLKRPETALTAENVLRSTNWWGR